MGELADLQTALGGQFNLNDWLGQQDNEATPKGLVPAILPVQEMREFQRRYRFDSGGATLQIGEVETNFWRVPEGEYWRALALLYTNDDTVAHDIFTTATVDPAGVAAEYRPSRTRVDAKNTKVIYGTDQDSTMSGGTNTFWMSKLPMILEPRDEFGFKDDDVAVSVSTQLWTFIYEIVPRPGTPSTRGVKGLTTVV